MSKPEKEYGKCVLVVDNLSYLKYCTYSGFKSHIRRTKYHQRKIISDYTITVHFTVEKIKIKLSTYLASSRHVVAKAFNCPTRIADLYFLIPLNFRQTIVTNYSFTDKINKKLSSKLENALKNALKNYYLL